MLLQTLKRALSVLVVDDNKDLCQNVKEVLDSAGYQSACVYDGFKAIEHVQKSPPDIILMDVKLPGMNGVEVFKKIKKIIPKVGVIMITGYSVDELVEEAIREGARGYMNKPLDFDRLFALIENKDLPPARNKT